MRLLRFFSQLRLRHKFSLVMSALVMTIIGIVLYLLYTQQKSAILAEVRHSAVDLVTALAVAGVGPTMQGEYLVMQGLVDGLGQHEGVRQVMILSLDGKILAHTYSIMRDSILRDLPWRRADVDRFPIILTDKLKDENVLDVTTHMLADKVPQAYARAIVSLRPAEEAVRVVARNIFWLGVASLAVALLLAAFLSGLVIKPLKKLYHDALQIGRGEREIRIDVTAGDEIGTLQQALKTMIEEVRLRSRMAALGVTMANLSHEIRTPLAAITHCINELFTNSDELETPTGAARAQRREQVLSQVNRLNDLVKELLLFSQNRKLVLSRTNINDLIKQSLFLLEGPMKTQRIRVKEDFGALPAIPADKNLLQSVFNNLISNAVEAMNDEGMLYIQTRRVRGQRHAASELNGTKSMPLPKPVSPASRWRRILNFFRNRAELEHSATAAAVSAAMEFSLPAEMGLDGWPQKLDLPPLPPEKEAIVLIFADNGHGIPDEVMDQLFLPFFTTKENGTGLGLALSHKVIQDHRGKIYVQSQVGKGTIFIIVLPL
jgi:signal transduction histidine kinase